MTPLQHLLDRVEKAEECSRELFYAIVNAVVVTEDLATGIWSLRTGALVSVQAWTEAALALVERVLPGWSVGMYLDKDEPPIPAKAVGGAKVQGPAEGDYASAQATTPALALLAALLKALIAQGGEGSSGARAESDGSAVRTETPSAAGAVEFSEVAAAMIGARWVCARCGQDAADARQFGCSRSPCPMDLTDAR